MTERNGEPFMYLTALGSPVHARCWGAYHDARLRPNERIPSPSRALNYPPVASDDAVWKQRCSHCGEAAEPDWPGRQRVADDAVASLGNRLRRMAIERDEARAHARILAHAYKSDNRPPENVVNAALAYPVVPAPPLAPGASSDRGVQEPSPDPAAPVVYLKHLFENEAPLKTLCRAVAEELPRYLGPPPDGFRVVQCPACARIAREGQR